MADRHWVGGTGNWSDTAHWDEHSGGAGGDTVPGQSDNVHFDENSFTAAGQVVTLTAGAYCTGLNWTGATNNPTLSMGANSIFANGNITFISSMSVTATTGYILIGGSCTFTSNSLVLGCNVAAYYGAAAVTLADDLNIGAFTIMCRRGSFSTANYTVTCGLFYDGASTSTHTITLGSSVLNCTAWSISGTNITLSANTASIRITGIGAFAGCGLTSYYELQLNGSTHLVSGNNEFVNLIRNGIISKTASITFTAGSTQKVTGTLSLIGYSSTIRLLVQSSSLTIPATLDVDGNWNNTANVDFMDINVAHDIDLSAITGLSGDCGGNNQAGATGTITFTASTPQYWHNATGPGGVSGGGLWSSASWFLATNGGGGAGHVPLPQDDVYLDANSIDVTGQTITFDTVRLGRTFYFTDLSQATAFNLAGDSVPVCVYGSFFLCTNFAANIHDYFEVRGRDGNYTFDTKDKSLGRFYLIAPGAVYTCISPFRWSPSTGYAGILAGTFDAGTQNVNGGTLSITGSLTRSILMGTGTWTLVYSSWTVSGTNFTVDASQCTFIMSRSTTFTMNFYGGGVHYNNVIFQGAGIVTFNITGNNTFNSLTVDRSLANKTLLFEGGSIQTVANFVCATSGTRTLTIGSSNTTPATIIKTGGGSVTVDYIALSYNTATPGSTWFSGSNITYGLSVTGWNEVPTASAAAIAESPSLAYDFVIFATTASATAAGIVPSLALDFVIFAVTAAAAPASSVPTLSTGTDSSPPSIPSTARVETPSLLVEIYISPSACEASADAAVPDVSVSESNESTQLRADAEIPAPQVSTGTTFTQQSTAEAISSMRTPEVGIAEDNEAPLVEATAEFPVPQVSVSESNESTQLRADAEFPIPQISTGTTIAAALGGVTASQPVPALFIESYIFPPTAGAAAAAPTPAVSYGTTITAATMTATAAVLATHLYVWYHTILEAAYFVEAPDVNRAFVVGSTAAGAQVSGSAITQADVDLVGERLSAHHNPAIPTATVAAAVAAAQLAKARLDAARAQVTIPPHCGVELWDVVNIADTVANQATTYRVNGYTLEFRSGVYRHTLDLCAP